MRRPMSCWGWVTLKRRRMRSRVERESPYAVMPDRFLKITIVMLSAVGGLATAAVAPMSPKELRIASTHILKGKVLEVKSRIEKSKSERAFGLHRDRVFTIRLQVTAVSKGKDVERGKKIIVSAWKPATRIPPVPGPQGHSPIPKKGQVVTIHVASKEGANFVPIMPNGIRIEDS